MVLLFFKLFDTEDFGKNLFVWDVYSSYCW